MLIQLLLLLLPWRIRRAALCRLYGWRLDKASRIGFSVLRVRSVRMAPGAVIGHLTFAKGLETLELGEEAILGSLNWVTAFPKGDTSFFSHVVDRDPSLRIGAHAAVTARHLIDCTAGVTVGAFTTVGGWGSQLLTHSIDIATSRQDAAPIVIGSHCFVGTRVVVLKGARLPDRSVLAAGSVYGGQDAAALGLFSGVPATRQRELSADLAYFRRQQGFVR